MPVYFDFQNVNKFFLILVIGGILVSFYPIIKVIALKECAFFVKIGKLCPGHASKGVLYYIAIDIIAIIFVLSPGLKIKKSE